MDKILTPGCNNSSATSDSSPAGKKNDSFLEDMELFSHNRNFYISSREPERHITKRTSSPVNNTPFATVLEENFEQRRIKDAKAPATIEGKTVKTTGEPSRRELGSGDDHRGVAIGRELKVKLLDSKLKNTDNNVRLGHSKTKVTESRTRLQVEPNKVQQERKNSVKDRSRRSGSCKDKDQSSDASDECRQTCNISKQTSSISETSKDHHRRSDGMPKIETREVPESVALLNGIKEIVSTYTREEGMRITRVLNELHILGQASLIKNLMFQTDEIRKNLQLGENLGKLRALMDENEILKENFALLKMKYEKAQIRLEETERIKEENAMLKLKLQELSGRKSS